jgi:hypothetical protein
LLGLRRSARLLRVPSRSKNVLDRVILSAFSLHYGIQG